MSETDCSGSLPLNRWFISTSLCVSLILFFSFWQVNQEAVVKSSIVSGAPATLGCAAPHEGSLATLVTFHPGCRILARQLLVTMYASLWFCSQNVTVTSLQVAPCYRNWRRFSTTLLPGLIFPLFVDNGSRFNLFSPHPPFPLLWAPSKSLRLSYQRHSLSLQG